MDSEEQGTDQRKQLLTKRKKRGRSQDEWDRLALKAILVDSEWAAWIRDNYQWSVYGRNMELKRQALDMMKLLGIDGTCQPSTFLNNIARNLRRLRREARVALGRSNNGV